MEILRVTVSKLAIELWVSSMAAQLTLRRCVMQKWHLPAALGAAVHLGYHFREELGVHNRATPPDTPDR